MFSGKSTLLLTRYRRYQLAGKKCLLVKYSKDKRYDKSGEMLITHDQQKYKATSCDHLAEVHNLVLGYDVICIDEIQFFEDASIYCDLWANAGKMVEVCGLNGDYRRKPFEQISQLIPICDDISHVKAVCKFTGEDAPFTKRLSSEKEQAVIGSSDKYVAVSRTMYMFGDLRHPEEEDE